MAFDRFRCKARTYATMPSPSGAAHGHPSPSHPAPVKRANNSAVTCSRQTRWRRWTCRLCRGLFEFSRPSCFLFFHDAEPRSDPLISWAAAGIRHLGISSRAADCWAEAVRSGRTTWLDAIFNLSSLPGDSDLKKIRPAEARSNRPTTGAATGPSALSSRRDPLPMQASCMCDAAGSYSASARHTMHYTISSPRQGPRSDADMYHTCSSRDAERLRSTRNHPQVDAKAAGLQSGPAVCDGCVGYAVP